MKTRTPRISEARFQAQVIQLAHLFAWRVAHFRPAQMRSGRWCTPVQADGAGFPDLLLTRGAELIVAELKVPPNLLQPAQKQWLDDFTRAGVRSYLWYPEDWQQIEEVLSR